MPRRSRHLELELHSPKFCRYLLGRLLRGTYGFHVVAETSTVLVSRIHIKTPRGRGLGSIHCGKAQSSSLSLPCRWALPLLSPHAFPTIFFASSVSHQRRISMLETKKTFNPIASLMSEERSLNRMGLAHNGSRVRHISLGEPFLGRVCRDELHCW